MPSGQTRTTNLAVRGQQKQLDDNKLRKTTFLVSR